MMALSSFIRSAGINAIEVNVALIVKSKNNAATLFDITNSDPVGNQVTWTDGVDFYVGDSVTFINWSDTSEKTVIAYCKDTSLITNAAQSWQNIEITFIDFSKLTDLSGTINLNGNPLATLIDAPISNTVDEIQLQNSVITTFNWKNYPKCNYLQMRFNTVCSTLDLGTGIDVDLNYLRFQGTADVDLSSFTGIDTNCYLRHEGSGEFTAPTGIGTGTLDDLTIDVVSNTIIDLSVFTKFSGSCEFRVKNNALVTSILFPTTTAGSGMLTISNNDAVTSVDLSGISSIYNTLQVSTSLNLTSITLPTITVLSYTNYIFSSNDLNYFNMSVLSDMFAFNNVDVDLRNNNMDVADVNHILVDLAAHVSGESAGGDYTGRTIRIQGSNDAPDGSSGGYDGDQAVIDLVAKSITVTTS